MSNFLFIEQSWPELYQKAERAERRVLIEPDTSAFTGRLALEWMVHKIYELEKLDLPFNKDLFSLLSEVEFVAILPANLKSGVHIIRKTGNSAAHAKHVSSRDSLRSVRYLFDFVKWFSCVYSYQKLSLPGRFNEDLIPTVETAAAAIQKSIDTQKELDEIRFKYELLAKEREEELEKAKESEETYIAYLSNIQHHKNAISDRKLQRNYKSSSEYTEKETRIHLIDANLIEAGWNELRQGYHVEYPVQGMPISTDNPKGNGYADYVLWDDNGKPLAVIEAKRASRSIEEGKHQAKLYADCLEKMHGQRPIIFYSNGYDTNIWDDRFYSAPRPIYGFLKKDELQLRINQRENRKNILRATIEESISGRHYQIEAIKRVAESLVTDEINGFRGKKREALLVMATGSGKTRTAAGLVDVLVKNNWAKTVLFLADRNALVRQAKSRFSEFLPHLSSIDLTKESDSDSTRLVFSTYPTMLNRIDFSKEGDSRTYGVGHFDLIIVDEAHRSIYNRYQAIFDYFDAIIVGLTATPKNAIDFNTYELFGCPDGDPTFSYTLEEAVPTYLKPFENISIDTKFIREGIKYEELTAAEKVRYEETFMDNSTGLFPEQIASSEMNKTLFNVNTVHKVLDSFISKCLKIEGGDKIGRTIIFAGNQKHAEFIVKQFEIRYPEYPPGFIAMVHNKVSHTESLIDAFCDEFKENLPQIVVSVDMMDTGIDAPRVLNLVFFKVVRSYSKFWQMIGRGTRLCPDVFGPNQAKEKFLIFDVCRNFEFFEIEQNQGDSRPSQSLTQRIFNSSLELSVLLAETGELEDLALAAELRNTLHYAISGLDRNRVSVKMRLRWVDEFSDRKRWNNLSKDDVNAIISYLSDLPTAASEDEIARRFDLLILKLQLAKLLGLNAEVSITRNLVEIANQLSKKYTIPDVLKSKELIDQMCDVRFYQEISQRKLDQVREEIRELVQYLDRSTREIVYTDFEDSEVTIEEGGGLSHSQDLIPYKSRVEEIIRANSNHITISKLKTNQTLTIDEIHGLEQLIYNPELGNKEDFTREFGPLPLGRFVRSIVGLTEAAARQAFSEFINVPNIDPKQITFINTLIQSFTKNGIIEPAMLFEPPFTNLNENGVIGVFDDADAHKIISIIRQINHNADVG